MPPELIHAAPFVGSAIAFAWYQFEARKRRKAREAREEERQYRASGIYETRLTELLAICGSLGFTEVQYCYIASRVIGQARRSMIQATTEQPNAIKLGLAQAVIGPVVAIFSAAAATLPVQYQSACLVAVSVFTGILSIINAIIPYLRFDDKLKESRGLAQALISELCSYLGGTDRLGPNSVNDYADLDMLTTGFTAFSTAIEIIIAKSEMSQLSLIPSSTPPDAEQPKDNPKPRKTIGTYDRDGTDY